MLIDSKGNVKRISWRVSLVSRKGAEFSFASLAPFRALRETGFEINPIPKISLIGCLNGKETKPEILHPRSTFEDRSAKGMKPINDPHCW
jgi:hypothetical protein